ncbi:MAG: hypothetical protein DVB31_16190 [Verrucomicrobia bacterium]|nr:MAG: hypothetical protein DVB31_16190 [Verrucomicrobiota bacterium]
MKIRSTRWMVAVAASLALAGIGRADTVVYTFTQTFSLTASPTGATPQINTTWNVPKYNGFAASTSLTKVQYDVSTQITYSGTMVPLAASQGFNLQIRSDFNFDFESSTTDVTALDPSITQGGTSGLANVYFGTGTLTSAANSATQLASDLTAYVGVGTVAVPVTGSLLTTSSGGSYQNNSDIGMASPYVFVDQNKIFPVFGLQQ